MITSAIAVVGSYNRDTSLLVSHFPAAGETIHALRSSFSHGGKGSNQAVQAARLGVSVAMVACLGGDHLAQAAKQLWLDENIAAEAVAVHASAATGSATILIDPQGENLIIVVPGANAELSAEHVANAASVIAAASVVVAQLEIPPASVAAAFRIARGAGVTTILNAAPAPPKVDPDLLALTDYLVVNEGEALVLAAGPSDPLNAARSLLQFVGHGVVLTRGARGAVLLEKAGGMVSASAPAIVPVDTTGAGDALTGTFAALLVEGMSAQAALEVAVRAGSIACTGHGAIPSFGSRSQILMQG